MRVFHETKTCVANTTSEAPFSRTVEVTDLRAATVEAGETTVMFVCAEGNPGIDLRHWLSLARPHKLSAQTFSKLFLIHQLKHSEITTTDPAVSTQFIHDWYHARMAQWKNVGDTSKSLVVACFVTNRRLSISRDLSQDQLFATCPFLIVICQETLIEHLSPSLKHLVDHVRDC